MKFRIQVVRVAGDIAAEPFAEMKPSFRDTGETPMLPSAQPHAAPKARQGVFPSRNVQTPEALRARLRSVLSLPDALADISQQRLAN